MFPYCLNNLSLLPREGAKSPVFIVSSPFRWRTVLICEQILNEDKSGPLPALLNCLLMLVETGGKERSASEYKLLLEKHGFVDVQAKKVYFSKDAILCKKLLRYIK